MNLPSWSIGEINGYWATSQCSESKIWSLRALQPQSPVNRMTRCCMRRIAGRSIGLRDCLGHFSSTRPRCESFATRKCAPAPISDAWGEASISGTTTRSRRSRCTGGPIIDSIVPGNFIRWELWTRIRGIRPADALESHAIGDHRGLVFIDTVDGQPPRVDNMGTLVLDTDYFEGLLVVQGHVALSPRAAGNLFRSSAHLRLGHSR